MSPRRTQKAASHFFTLRTKSRLEKFSALKEVQDMAAKATFDFEAAGAQPPTDLQFMATLGSSGTYKKLSCKLVRCLLNMPIEVTCAEVTFLSKSHVPK